MAEIEKKIWDFLKKQGYTDAGVAGIMGNLYAESALSPTNLEDYYENKLKMNDVEYTLAVDNGTYTNFVNDSAGYGLAQWTYWSRKQGLLNYAKQKGTSIADLNMQLEYLIKELNGYSRVSILKTTSSILEASNFMLLDFERPADQSSSVQQRRASYGQRYYDAYAGANKPVAGKVNEEDLTAENLLNIARAELGYKEKASNSSLDSKTANAGSNNWTKYARDLAAAGYYNGNKNGYAWCDVFVDWCMYQLTGQDSDVAQYMECQTGPLGAGCTYSARYYKNAGRFYTSNPEPGDQIFFGLRGDEEHTGIVEAVDYSYVYTIEGNSNNQVERRKYTLNNSYIAGYGRPRFYEKPVEEPKPIEEDEEEMTQEKFNEMMAAWLESQANRTTNADWSAAARKWAEDNGYIQGDDKNRKMYKKFLTREEFVTVLYRILGKK